MSLQIALNGLLFFLAENTQRQLALASKEGAGGNDMSWLRMGLLLATALAIGLVGVLVVLWVGVENHTKQFEQFFVVAVPVLVLTALVCLAVLTWRLVEDNTAVDVYLSADALRRSKGEQVIKVWISCGGHKMEVRCGLQRKFLCNLWPTMT